MEACVLRMQCNSKSDLTIWRHTNAFTPIAGARVNLPSSRVLLPVEALQTKKYVFYQDAIFPFFLELGKGRCRHVVNAYIPPTITARNWFIDMWARVFLGKKWRAFPLGQCPGVYQGVIQMF